MLKKTVSLLLLIATILSVLSSCASGSKKYIEEIPISDEETVKHSEGFAKSEASRLYTALENKISELQGTKPPFGITLLKNDFEEAIYALEKRGVCENNVTRIVDRLIENGDVFDGLLGSSNVSTAFPVSELALLFRELSCTLGANDTAFFLYDVALIYCYHMSDKYYELYKKTPVFTYLNELAQEWRTKAIQLKKIDEASFAYSLRALISLSTLLVDGNGNSDETSFVFTLSSGELTLFLNNEGNMLSKVSLTEENAQFIMNELCGGIDAEPFKAISATDDTARYAESMNDMLKLISSILKKIDKGIAKEIKNGNLNNALYEIMSNFDDEDYENLTRIISNEETIKYELYFRKNGMFMDYSRFKGETGTATLEELKAAEKDEFLSVLKAYICSEAPALAFTVFYDKSQES